MLKRAFDIVGSAAALCLLSPVLLVAALAVKWGSPGPIFYRARRVGREGKPFLMYKFRTMHVREEGPGSPITGAEDTRVFPVGRLLRRTKVDELPQLWDVLRGEMSIVGPRPEDPGIVACHYSPEDWETLRVRPGLSSPGSLFYYMHGEHLLTGDDPERLYCDVLLPVKLRLDREYLRRATLLTDLGVILQTAWVIGQIALGRREFPGSAEAQEAGNRLAASRLRA